MIILLPFLYLVLCFVTETFRVNPKWLVGCILVGLIWDIFTQDNWMSVKINHIRIRLNGIIQVTEED